MANMLERVAKLLNQAENASNEEEAASYMEAAQRLSRTYSIDLAHARHATISKQRTVPVQRDIHIGVRGTRGLRTLTDLYLGIAHANDIQCTIAHDGSTVYAVGFAEDLDVSEAMFASLQIQQAKALDAFKSEGSWVGETYLDEKTWAEKPVTWLTARLNFQAAYGRRIAHRLMMARLDEQNAREEAEAASRLSPHLDESGVLTDSFLDWFIDRQGLDLTEDNETAVEMSSHLMSTKRSLVGGAVGTVVTDEAGVFGMWLAEIIEAYASEIEKDQDDAGTAVVLVEKKAAVDEAYEPLRRRARGSFKGGTQASLSRSGRSAGASAADRARLGSSTAIGGVKGVLTR